MKSSQKQEIQKTDIFYQSTATDIVQLSANVRNNIFPKGNK